MPSINQLADIQIPMVDEPAYTIRRLRVVTIGAGFSGLILAHKFQHEFPDLQDFVDHTIFEMEDEVGGTWKVNTYPGVQCDVPAHIYAFPFDPNPSWSKFYSDGDEILDYVKKICDKWDLRRDIKFNTKVVANEWQEEEGKWKITVEHNGQQRDEYADFLVSAQGFLRSVFLEEGRLAQNFSLAASSKAYPCYSQFPLNRAHRRHVLRLMILQSLEMAQYPRYTRFQGEKGSLGAVGPRFRLLPQANWYHRQRLFGNPDSPTDGQAPGG